MADDDQQLSVDDLAVLTKDHERSVQMGLPRSTNEIRDYTRHSAIVRGVDPGVAVRVALSEGGLNPATCGRSRGQDYAVKLTQPASSSR